MSDGWRTRAWRKVYPLRRDVSPKGNQVKMRGELDTQAQTNSAVSTNLRQLRAPAPTRSLRDHLEFDRYVVATSGLMLMVVLIVGAAGYAGIRGIFRTAAATSTPRTAEGNREAPPDRLVTNGAVALGLIGLLAVAVATNPSRVEATGLSPEFGGHRRIANSTARKFCRAADSWPLLQYVSFEPRPPMRHLTYESTRAASSARHPIDRT